VTTTRDMDVEEFRAAARAWLPQHLDRATGATPAYTSEHITAQREIQRRLYDGGFAGITWPERYGGLGLTEAHAAAFAEEAAGFQLPDFGILTITTFRACLPTMLTTADESFLERHVPAVLRGEELWCQFFSEPGAGSDMAGVRTRAVREGDGWRLTGSKTWSSFAHLADWAMCLARTDVDVPKHKGLTWFAVRTDADGLLVRPIRQISGGGDFCEEFLDDVYVPDTERIGEVGGGWSIAGTMLVHERAAGGRPVGGLEPGALDPDLVAMARSGSGLGPSQLHRLVTCHVAQYVSRQLELKTAELAREGSVTPGEASYAKLFRAGVSSQRGRIALQLAGAQGIAWTEGVGGGPGRAFLESKKPAIAGGTEQMQRNAISERVLGLPREPSYDAGRPFSEVLKSAGKWTSERPS
jgi:alkylation response protein AidB-like acyl-CoA dehydrogenase